MIPISKGREPNELLAYRKQIGASYAGMPSDVKVLVKRALAEEQGFLCAYCMRRLSSKSVADAGNSKITIEHWSPQNPQDGSLRHDPLDYGNMLAVCDGNRRSSHNELTCDAARGNTPLTVNPLKPDTLASIHYSRNGEIHSSSEEIEHDLTVTLNLNCDAVSLPENRKKALQALQREIERKFPSKGVSREALRKILNNFESEAAKKTPYVGILTYWLRNRLQR